MIYHEELGMLSLKCEVDSRAFFGGVRTEKLFCYGVTIRTFLL